MIEIETKIPWHDLSEEAIKMVLITDHHYIKRERWLPFAKWDFVSSMLDFVLEVKKDNIAIEKVIFQIILTSIVANRTFNWYGGWTPYAEKCVPSYCIDRRLLELHYKDGSLRPSETSSPVYKALFGHFEPIIRSNLRDYPPLEERINVIKAKELHLKYSDEQFENMKRHPIFNEEEITLLKETELWRIDTSERDKLNAYYTPLTVVNQVKELVCKHWKFDQIWDCAAGDGHLVSWFDNVILSDIDPKITFHHGLIIDYLTLKKPIKEFGKNGIIIVNPSYNKRHIHHLIDFAERNKLRMCIFGPASLFPHKAMPIVDGFLSTGWGNGGEGRKERGQIILLLDFNKSCLDKTILSDGTMFECIPDEHAIKTSKGYCRYCCVASDSIVVSNELGINMFATCGKHRNVAGCFLSSKIDNYLVEHNGKGGRHGYGKNNPKRKSLKQR